MRSGGPLARSEPARQPETGGLPLLGFVPFVPNPGWSFYPGASRLEVSLSIWRFNHNPPTQYIVGMGTGFAEEAFRRWEFPPFIAGVFRFFWRHRCCRASLHVVSSLGCKRRAVHIRMIYILLIHLAPNEGTASESISGGERSCLVLGFFY